MAYKPYQRVWLGVLLLSVTWLSMACSTFALEPNANNQAESARYSPNSDANHLLEILKAEFSLWRGEINAAANIYQHLAQQITDEPLFSRATTVLTVEKRFPEALELAKKWQAFAPKSGDAHRAVLGLMIETDQTSGLDNTLKQYLKFTDDATEVIFGQLPRILARARTPNETIAYFDKMVQKEYSTIPEAFFAIAQSWVSIQRYARGLDAIEQALKLRPSWQQAAILKSVVLAQDHQTLALNWLKNYVARYPQADDARLLLARQLVNLKQYYAARPHFDRLLRENKTPDIMYAAALLALQVKDLSAAEKRFQQLDKLSDEFNQRNAVKFHLGQIYEQQKQYAKAVRYYQYVNPSEFFQSALNKAAALHYQHNGRDLLKTRSIFAHARAKYPQQEVAVVLLEAQFLRTHDQLAAGHALLEDYINKFPNHEEILYDAAIYAEQLKRYPLVEQRLRHLIKVSPKNAHAYNALGYFLADRNERLHEAYQLIKKAVELEPNNPMIQDSLGWVYFRQGQYKKALELLRTAYGQNPDPEIAAHLGEVLWSLGKQLEAKSLWRLNLKKHPGNDVLKNTIKRIAPES